MTFETEKHEHDGLQGVVRLRLNLFWYKPPVFSYGNHALKILFSIRRTWFTKESRKGCIKKRSTRASLPPVVNMPTFYFSSLNQNCTLTIINRITIITWLFLSSFQNLQLQISRFCRLQSPSRNVVHSRASISPSNVQSFLLNKNCFVQHNMKQRGHVQILHGHNWIRELEGYINVLPRIKRRVQSTNSQADQLSQAQSCVERRLVKVTQFLIILCAACANWVWELRWLMPVFAFLTVLTLQGQRKKQANA